MRTTGIVLAVFGALAALGAIVGGSSMFGPLVFIGIGIMLILKAKEKEEKKQNQTAEKPKAEVSPTPEPAPVPAPEPNEETSDCEPELQEEYEDMNMFSSLTVNQKIAMFMMMSNLASAPTDGERQGVARKMSMQSMEMMGLSENDLVSFMQNNRKPSGDEMVATIRTIKNEGVMKWLIYSCYGIVQVNQNNQAHNYMMSWLKQLGYNEDYVLKTVKEIEALGNMLR